MDAQTILQQFAAAMSPASGGDAFLGGSKGGALSSLGELQKALTASNYQTDVATLSGGGALGVQSLDMAMKTVIQENEHFVLFNRLQSSNATNIVDEYTRQTGVGGFLGGSFNTQMGVVRAAQGAYEREVGYVKFLMGLRQVGYVLTLGKNIAEPMAVEERNGALQLLTDAEYKLFHGDSDASPTEYDGIFAMIDKAVAAGQMSGDNIYDMKGAKLDSVEPFSMVNVAVSRYGSWGKTTDVFMPVSVQNDLNMGLDPAFRWSSQSGTTMTIGGHVEGIRLQSGVLKTNMDTFIHDETHPMVSPFEVNNAATATANVGFKPATLTVDASTSDAASTFSSTRAGNYYWAVAGIGANGEGMSAITVSAQTAVAAGKKAVLTIGVSASGTESGYAVYRSKQAGVATASELRLVGYVKKAGATTTYTDNNSNIPGTVRIPLLNLSAGADAIGWRQFQPMTKIPLPFGIGGMPQYSWFQFLFGYLRMPKPKHHGYVKNILTKNSVWRPFTAE